MEISVIVPIYGVEKYIERALTSLFTQSKTDGVEFILVNDCTKDRSMEIAREVASNYPELNIIFIDKEVNGGLAAARQTGMCAAQGTYVLHIDSDDWTEPNMLEDLYKKAKETDVDIVICDFYTNFPNKQIYNKQSITKSNGLECAILLLEGNIRGYVWNKFIKRSLFVKNAISWIPNINMWEDKLIVTKLFCCTDKIAYLPKAYLHYMQNSESMVNTMSESSRLNLMSAIENMTLYFKEKSVYDELQEALKFSKLSVKSSLLVSSNSYNNQKIVAAIYPDCYAEIFYHPTLPMHYKIALFHAIKGRLFIANTIYRIISIIKRIIR